MLYIKCYEQKRLAFNRATHRFCLIHKYDNSSAEEINNFQTYKGSFLSILLFLKHRNIFDVPHNKQITIFQHEFFIKNFTCVNVSFLIRNLDLNLKFHTLCKYSHLSTL